MPLTLTLTNTITIVFASATTTTTTTTGIRDGALGGRSGRFTMLRKTAMAAFPEAVTRSAATTLARERAIDGAQRWVLPCPVLRSAGVGSARQRARCANTLEPWALNHAGSGIPLARGSEISQVWPNFGKTWPNFDRNRQAVYEPRPSSVEFVQCWPTLGNNLSNVDPNRLNWGAKFV